MKKMKKLLSVLVAATMTLAMAATSFAAGSGTGTEQAEKGSITITNAIPGQSYSIYKLFDLESYSYAGDNAEDEPAVGQYAYKVTEAWRSFVTENGAGAGYINVDAQGYVTWKGQDTAERREAFAKAALKYAKDNTIAATAGPSKAPAAAEGDDRSSVSFERLNLGYYLVDSTAGALCGLTTTNPTINITEKNAGVPDVKKEIVRVDGETPDNSQAADAMIGTKIEYKVEITAKKGAENYVFHDTMSKGLTFNKDLTVTGVPSDSYHLITENVAPYTFNVTFDQAALNDLAYNDKGEATITINYTATLNEDAVTTDVGNTNEATLSYGNENTTTSEPKNQTKVTTYEFDLVKTTDETEKDKKDWKVLPGAQFKLYGTNADGNINMDDEIRLMKVPAVPATDDTPAVEAYYCPVVPGKTAVETIDVGQVAIKGLKKGTYCVKEIKAPDGYNKLADNVNPSITVGEAGHENMSATVTPGAGENNPATYVSGGLQVINKTGSVLPSTGGIGTTIFYAAGIILMAGAVFFVVRRRRA